MPTETTQAIIVLITAPSEEVARLVSQALLDRRLAACVNITPVRSFYWWESAIQDEAEVLLIVKSRAEIFHQKLVPVVQEVHPYDVPEIIALPIVMGSKSYLDWIEAETET